MARVSRALPHLSAAEVQEKIRTAPNVRRSQKWLIIYNALIDPRTAAEIANHTGTSIRTVHQVISEYNRLGVEATLTPGSGGRRHSYLNLEEEQRVLERLKPKAKRGEITSKTQIKQAFEQQVGHPVHKTTIYRLLARHQWRKLKPRPRHPKADPEEQAAFLKGFAQQVEAIIQQRDVQDTRPVLLMAEDEGRFGRTGTLCSCWCPPGETRPSLARQQLRQYVYAYAAVAPSLGRMCCLILPHANTAMMSLFLAQLSIEFADYFIILQVDRAAWHRAKHLEIPENIRLLAQPAYSPEVMPVEHLWEEMREKHFNNRIFNSLDAVEDTLCKAFNDLIAAPEQVRSMTFFPHLRITF